jgi:hypothetical protein
MRTDRGWTFKNKIFKRKKNWSENEKKGNSDRIVGKAGNKTRNVKANREETKANKRR